MRTPYEQSLRKQVYDYLYGLAARIRFSNGGGSNLEVSVQPDNQGNGVFLYMIDNGGQEFHVEGKGVVKTPRTEKYVRLTPKNARRLAHALLFMVGESEIEERDEALTPPHG